MHKGIEALYAADGDMTKIDNHVDNLMEILFYGMVKKGGKLWNVILNLF